MGDKDKDAVFELLIRLAKESGVVHEKNTRKVNQMWNEVANAFNKETGQSLTGQQVKKKISNR